MKVKYFLLLAGLLTSSAYADNSTMDAAIGGGIGGAIGAAIGNEVGGREGAVIGGAIGGGVGTAVATDGDSAKHHSEPTRIHVEPSHSHRFCPPGQAKKGNC